MFLVAASSIHTSRGFSGYKSPSCDYPWLYFRFLGPTVRIALVLTALWSLVLSVHITLLVYAIEILVKYALALGSGGQEQASVIGDTQSLADTPASAPLSSNILVLALILGVLSVIILTTVVLILRIDMMYDPD